MKLVDGQRELKECSGDELLGVVRDWRIVRHSSRARWGRVVSVVASSALVAAIAVTGSLPAHAAVTGTAGLYVPSQGRILDTRNGIGGYSTPMQSGVTRQIQVTGTAAVQASAVTAVQVIVSAVDPTSRGTLSGAADGGTLALLMVYDGTGGGNTSNSAILAVPADGKIQIATQTAVNVVVDVQGYYTAGNGTTAPGGYSPVAGSRIFDTRAGTGTPVGRIATGQVATVQATGVGGVPTGAAAVYVNITARNYGPSVLITPYAADKSAPNIALDVPTTNQAVPLGAQIALSPSGAFKLYVNGHDATTLDLFVDVEGYFMPGSSNGAFTPANGRLLDTRVAPSVAVQPNQTITVPIAGQQGAPAASDGLQAAVINMLAIDAQSGGGYARAWASGAPEPDPYSEINYSNDYQTNLITVPVGADGAIQIHNISADTVNFVLDLEGYYSPPPPPPAPSITCPAPYANGTWTDTLPTGPISCTITAAPSPLGNATVRVGVNGQVIGGDLQRSLTQSVSKQISIPNASGWYQVTAVGAFGDFADKPVTYSFGLNDGTPSSNIATIRKADPTVFTNVATTATTGPGVAAAQATSDGASVSIPTAPTDGITLNTPSQTITDAGTGGTSTVPGSGSTVGLPFGTQAQGAVSEAPGVVSYDNNNNSTTVPVAKTDGTVQIVTIIRNANASHSYVYPLTLGADQHIQIEGDGSATVRNGADNITAYVPAPWAKDATGISVPTHYETDGTTLTQVVDFTATSAFPVVADPSWAAYWWGYLVKFNRSDTKTTAKSTDYSSALAMCALIKKSIVGVICTIVGAKGLGALLAPLYSAARHGNCVTLNQPWVPLPPVLYEVRC